MQKSNCLLDELAQNTERSYTHRRSIGPLLRNRDSGLINRIFLNQQTDIHFTNGFSHSFSPGNCQLRISSSACYRTTFSVHSKDIFPSTKVFAHYYYCRSVQHQGEGQAFLTLLSPRPSLVYLFSSCISLKTSGGSSCADSDTKLINQMRLEPLTIVMISSYRFLERLHQHTTTYCKKIRK